MNFVLMVILLHGGLGVLTAQNQLWVSGRVASQKNAKDYGFNVSEDQTAKFSDCRCYEMHNFHQVFSPGRALDVASCSDISVLQHPKKRCLPASDGRHA